VIVSPEPRQPEPRQPAAVRLNLHRAGSGPPLLLIHGIGHRWRAWEPVLDRLADAHEVIAVDLPGFGDSPLPDDGAPLDIGGTVARLGRFLRQQEIARPHVAGNSLGGAIALELAAAGLAASVTAFSPAGFYAGTDRWRAAVILSWLRAQTFLPPPVLRAALRTRAIRAASMGALVAHPSRLDPDRLLADALALRHGRGFRPVLRALGRYRFDGTALQAMTDVPVTVAWGARDRILPPHHAARARQVLPRASHVTLPGCGHLPMSDDPSLVAGTILATTGVRSRRSAPEE
jgi:pimeloyl-ACP methyl ester carboxylesterase